jgi:predicted dehydrogenase
MSGPLRIGVIGTGYGQQVHVPAFRADTRCEVVAICARTAERAARVAERLGIPRSFGDARDMLASGKVDAVSIAVPPAQQPELVIAAAEAGKHVFCEKPFAAEVLEAERALRAVEQSGVRHAMDFIFPEMRAWQEARARLREGTIGKLRFVSLAWRVETYAFRAGVDSWKMHAWEGGGTLNQFVSHSLYYLEWLLGAVGRVAARLTPRGSAGDAHADLWLELASGCPVTVSVAADAFLGSGHRLEIYGEQGSLVLENRAKDYVNGFTLSVGTREKGTFSTQEFTPFADADGRIGAASAIARRFVDSILSDRTVEPNLADGLRVQRLIAAAREADRTGGWQSVCVG